MLIDVKNHVFYLEGFIYTKSDRKITCAWNRILLCNTNYQGKARNIKLGKKTINAIKRKVNREIMG